MIPYALLMVIPHFVCETCLPANPDPVFCLGGTDTDCGDDACVCMCLLCLMVGDCLPAFTTSAMLCLCGVIILTTSISYACHAGVCIMCGMPLLFGEWEVEKTGLGVGIVG